MLEYLQFHLARIIADNLIMIILLAIGLGFMAVGLIQVIIDQIKSKFSKGE